MSEHNMGDLMNQIAGETGWRVGRIEDDDTFAVG
jgi:hypothetical protein